MKEQMNVLDELNKGACMGMDAIDFIENRSKRGIGTSKNAE